MSSTRDQGTDDRNDLSIGSKTKKKRKRKKKEWNFKGNNTLSFHVAYQHELESVFKKQGAFGLKAKCHPDSFVRVKIQHGNLAMDCSQCGMHMMSIALKKGKDIQLQLCQKHIANGVKITYNNAKVYVDCPFCNFNLHKFTVENNG